MWMIFVYGDLFSDFTASVGPLAYLVSSLLVRPPPFFSSALAQLLSFVSLECIDHSSSFVNPRCSCNGRRCPYFCFGYRSCQRSFVGHTTPRQSVCDVGETSGVRTSLISPFSLEYITIASIMVCMTVWDFVIGVLFGIIMSCKCLPPV